MGKDEFIRRLDEGFEKSCPDFASEGKYVNVGNQPNMQAPWLFNYAGAPYLPRNGFASYEHLCRTQRLRRGRGSGPIRANGT